MPQHNFPESSTKRFQKNGEPAQKLLYLASYSQRAQPSAPKPLVSAIQPKAGDAVASMLSPLFPVHVCKTIIIRTPLPAMAGAFGANLVFETVNFFQALFKTAKGERQPLFSLNGGVQAFGNARKTARH
jgi:hypothetical protein